MLLHASRNCQWRILMILSLGAWHPSFHMMAVRVKAEPVPQFLSQSQFLLLLVLQVMRVLLSRLTPVLDHTIALAAVMVSRVVESRVHMSFNHCTFAPDYMTDSLVVRLYI